MSSILQLHTVEELVLYSNIAHWIEGGIFLIVVGIAFLQALGYLKGKQHLWPGLVLGAGLFLPLFSFSHHLGELGLAWQATVSDPQQRQHLFMAILLAIAGFAELKSWRTIFPIVLVIIGVLFLTHPQHGTSEAVLKAALIHTYLGITLVLSGIFKGAQVLLPNQRWLKFVWIIFLAIAAVLLIGYREPQGAYNLDLTNQHMPQNDY